MSDLKSNPDTGKPTVHSTTSRLQPTAVISKPVPQQNSEATCVNDKYFDYLVCSDSYEFSSSYEFENFLSQVHFLEKLDISCSKVFKGVKGRLAKHIKFWMTHTIPNHSRFLVGTKIDISSFIKNPRIYQRLINEKRIFFTFPKTILHTKTVKQI
jgi:hypothetical protein